MAATLAIATPAGATADRQYEGKWFISDSTDNNTGERNVYAFAWNLKPGNSDWVTLRMRCSNGKPTLFVEWEDLTFPDETVLTIGPVGGPDLEPAEEKYIFEKSTDPVEDGLRASPETSARIVAAIGKASYTTVSAHLPSGTRVAAIDVTGTQAAWSRVSRHCPIQTMPLPPL